ncbi:MAG: hypothetical protein ABI330_01535, partial [Caldimonas sp.]
CRLQHHRELDRRGLLNSMTFEKSRVLDLVHACAGPASRSIIAAAAATLLASCGGSSGNPLDNPGSVTNTPIVGGKTLAFAYFERCVNPIFIAQLPIIGSASTNTCAGAGCHAALTGTGGALRLVPTAQTLDVTNPANTPDLIRASDIYKNFISAEGQVLIGVPTQSRLINKPLLRGLLHGGGQVFLDASDQNVQIIQYWINHPAPDGQDEFSAATFSMFTSSDPQNGKCNIQ